MIILCEERQTELIVKKSRFIAIAKIIDDISQVRELVDKTRKEHPAANHVVHAAAVGSQFSFSDDKEPKNTAGRPAFEVLKGSGISNICILIVRYFGGTLLGTGGLVKAYSDSTKMVLDGIKTQVLISKTSFSLQIPYDMYETVKRTLSAFEAETVSEVFETDIKITANVASEAFEDLNKKITDLSCGKIALTKIV